MPIVRDPKLETLDTFLEHYLPKDHNDQDIVYLTERYKWMTIREYPWSKPSSAYKGTTFEKAKNQNP